MKILTVSDFVDPGLQSAWETGRIGAVDLVLACGDLPPEYLGQLANAFNVPLFYVLGNHDIRYTAKPAPGCTDIHARMVHFAGLSFLGLEGCHWYNGGPHQYTEWQMRMMILRLMPALWWRGGPDVVIAHAPPRFVHDGEDPCHRGFHCFHTLMRRFRPRYFIHGHIHRHFDDPAERMTRIYATTVVNAYGWFEIEIGGYPAA
jgi:Icc-related predicted phosphoesterase